MLSQIRIFITEMSQCLFGCWRSNGPGVFLLNHMKMSFELIYYHSVDAQLV